MSRVIGIDLGTTNSVVAVFEGGEPQIICNGTGQRTTPSVVGFTNSGEQLVGPPARNQQVTNPANTVYSIKRFIGRRHHEVHKEEKIVPYTVVGRSHEFVKIKIGRRRYAPQEIVGILLREMKRIAEVHLGETVDSAVITVPAYFNDSQRQATKDAGKIAGLDVKRIINEPTAAALAYGLEKMENKRIAVFDLGGGTFDLSILDIGGGTFKVLGVHGNTHLGGDDFDQRIIDVVADDFYRKELIDIRTDPMALQRLKEAAERAKCELSHRPEAAIMLPFIAIDGSGPKHLQHTLTRETFEAICTDLFDELVKGSQTILREANLKGGAISEVVLVGGSTRMPKVQDIAREVFQTTVLERSINPDEVVALGAATLGGVIQGDLRNVRLMDVTSRSLGVETVNGGMNKLIVKNTSIPTSTKRTFSTPRNNQTSVPIHVLEGESSRSEANRTLGLFQLTGIPPAPRGKPQIEVAFSIDVNGILKVTATDKETGKSQKIVIEGAIGLDRAEIERMKREAEERSAEDEVRKLRVDLRNHAEAVLHDMMKWMEYNAQFMQISDRARLVAALRKLEKKIRKEDEGGIKVALKKLDEVAKPLRKAG